MLSKDYFYYQDKYPSEKRISLKNGANKWELNVTFVRYNKPFSCVYLGKEIFILQKFVFHWRGLD